MSKPVKRVKRFGIICEGESTVEFFRSAEDILNHISDNGAMLVSEFSIKPRLDKSIRRVFRDEPTVCSISYSWKRFPDECGHIEMFGR